MTESMPRLEFERFSSIMERDRATFIPEDALTKWLHADQLFARGERKNMNVYGFEGLVHLQKFFRLAGERNVGDWLPDDRKIELVEISAARDRLCAERLKIEIGDSDILNVAANNAQDYIFQRMYPVLDSQLPRIVLDFGPGYGRTANLAFGDLGSATRKLVAVDAIPACYLVQRLYYRGLGLTVADYIDEDGEFDYRRAFDIHQVIHLPTWRMDMIPTASIDLICAVQVLKELYGTALVHVLKEFARILKPGGALYVRDHVQFHRPNQMPIDEMLSVNGFVIEYRPHVKDGIHVRGIPRLWRKYDTSFYIRDI